MDNEQLHDKRPDDELGKYSQSLREYVQHLEGKEKFSYQIKELLPHMTESEKAELNSFYLDPITYEVMDIPVLLNEIYYDLDTLLNLPRRETPVAREPFEYHHIEPAKEHKADLLLNLIERVKNRIDGYQDT